MRVVHTRGAGNDVHKSSVSVCIRHGKGKHVESTAMQYGMFTSHFQQMRPTLPQTQDQRVVMESTGAYWIPVWNVLECGDWKVRSERVA